MNIVEIKTLIDITDSGVERPYQGSQLELNQNRNWTTLNQCIGIRSIIEYYNSPVVETVDVKGMGFGTNFKGKHQVWTFRFETDRPEVFGENCELLIEDMDQVPVIKKLTESVNIDTAVFDTKSPALKNTIIRHPKAL
jgi:hypothetical protein